MRAHFVGSVNLESAEEVISAIADRAGEVAARIPDGETGERSLWFEWQVNVLARQSQLDGVGKTTEPGKHATESGSRFRVRTGISADEIELGSLGYAEAAVGSYQIFRRLKEAGRIPSPVKFLVSLPTPVPVTWAFMGEDHLTFETAYERHLLAEIAAMLDDIPPGELAIQWDVAIEMGMLEGVFPTYIDGDLLSEVVTRLGRLGDATPTDVSLGFHLCYGNRENEHWKEPQDAALLVQVANGLSAACSRQIDWIHMPVPIERDDDAFFEPLRDLTLSEGTELSLGLIHKEDGIEGVRRRMAAARKMVGEFGIATECGLGREPAEAITGLLDLHAAAARELTVP